VPNFSDGRRRPLKTPSFFLKRSSWEAGSGRRGQCAKGVAGVLERVLPWSLPSLRPYFSRMAFPRAARTAHRRRKLSVQAGGAGQGVRPPVKLWAAILRARQLGSVTAAMPVISLSSGIDAEPPLIRSGVKRVGTQRACPVPHVRDEVREGKFAKDKAKNTLTGCPNALDSLSKV